MQSVPQTAAVASRFVRVKSSALKKETGETQMRPSTNRAHQLTRGFILIAALLAAQIFAVVPVMADAPACPCSIFTASIDPGSEATDTTPSGVNLGIKFQSDTAGFIKAIRFYKHIDNTGTHTGQLWNADGTMLLGSAVFTNETATGWQEVALNPPAPITPGTTYVASYFAPNRAWPHNLDYFAQFGVDSPPLHVGAGAGNNGQYFYSNSPAFPSNFPPDHPTNYMVDVVFDTTDAATTTSPQVASITPAATTGVDPNTNIDITFDREVDATTINGTNVQLLDASNNVVPSTVTYPNLAFLRTATIIPTPVLTLSAQYSVVVTNGVKDLAGNAATPFSASFTTSATLPTYGCPCSLWNLTLPAGVSVNQSPSTDPVNLGTKFQSDATGYIKGIRFYKEGANNGITTVFLWTADGTLLASKQFPAGNSDTGWQEVQFDTSVAITRHTTYIAAYHTAVGAWAQSRPGFFETSPWVNSPLRALQSFFHNGNGLFASGPAGLFPSTDPTDAPNYWVDPIFDTSPTTVQSTVSIADLTANEGTSGTPGATNAFNFTVTLTPASTSPVTVNYTTAAGTAVADQDYITTSSSVTFAPGEISKTIPIQVYADSTYEQDDTFYVNLTSVTGATIARGTATGTIRNDDRQPVITVDNQSLQPPAKGTTAPMSFHITLANPSYQQVTVHYYTSNSTAIAGTDYTVTSGTATFPAGTTSVTVDVPIIGTKTNTQKAFFLNLDAPTNATIQLISGFPVKGRGTILAK